MVVRVCGSALLGLELDGLVVVSRRTNAAGSTGLRRFAAMAARLASTALDTMPFNGVGSRRSAIFPEVMRETSIRSSISRTMCFSWRSMMLRTCSTASGVPPPSRMTSSPVTSAWGAAFLRRVIAVPAA